MQIEIGNDVDLIAKAQYIRHQIFVIEQSIPAELDTDGLDEVSFHALVTDKDVLIATARLTLQEANKANKARVAVMPAFRGCGIASHIVTAMLNFANNKGVRTVEIHAHKYLQNYYEKFGFEYVQEVEMVGEHPLIEMVINIST